MKEKWSHYSWHETSVSTQLWIPLKSELACGSNLNLFGPCWTSREHSPPTIREGKSSQAWRSFAQWENRGDGGGGGVEDRSNEWVGQKTITTALSHAVDHDTSPANPSTLTSPSSPFNISCGAEHKHVFPNMCTRWVQETQPSSTKIIGVSMQVHTHTRKSVRRMYACRS